MQNCGVRLLPLDFRDQYFGCEIELTGINRATAAQTLADLFGTRAEHSGGGYDAYRVKDLDGKEWKIVRDGSIHPECRRRSVLIGETYKVELNSPKLEYGEMEKLQYMNNEMLCAGNTVAAIDELYLYLNNRTAIGYIRACMKRARKKESSLLLASQNVEDFLLPEAAELTKPLFSIPAYQFLFHPGTVDGGKYREALQLEECEYGVVRSCARGNCLFKCGDERYNLLVKTPPHKLRCYGTAGGR